MTTFIKKKLKDREGNYLVTPSSADIVYCSDGETVATKLRKVENDEFSPTITQMSSVSKVGVGEDIDISDNTQEGYLKSAILKGNTLVNLAQTFGYSYSWVGSTIDENNIVTADASIGSGYRWCHNPLNIGLIKPNTQYTVIVEVFENTLDDNLEVCYSGLNGVVYGTCFNQLEHIPIGFTGTYKVLATSKSNVTVNDQKLTTHIRLSNQTSGIVKYRVTILEGDYTNVDIPYFTGMQSVKMPVLTTTGKNLFDMNRRYDNLTNKQATVIQSLDKITISSAESGTYVNANFILDKEFFAGKTVTGSCLYESDEKGIGAVQINYADSSGKWYYQQIARPRTFTFPNNFIGDVMLCVYANNTGTPQSNTVTVKNIQLELGSVATSYEPHKSNILTVDGEYGSVGNVYDTADLINGCAILRTKEIILDGTENWRTNGTSDSIVSVAMTLESQSEGLNNLVSDKFTTGIGDIERIAMDATNLYLRIQRSKLISPDINGVKSWLSQNPTTVRYVLKEDVIKTVDLTPGGTNPTTKPYVWDGAYIQLSSEEGSLTPSLEYSVTTSRGGQILDNTRQIAKQDKRVYDLEMLLINASIDEAYKRLSLQNDVMVMNGECQTVPSPLRYIMLQRLIEEKAYETQDMLDKLDVFFMYGEITDEQYFELFDIVLGIMTDTDLDITEEVE